MSFLSLENTIRVKKHQEVMQAIYRSMASRNETLHAGQIKVAKALFNNNKRITQCQWGRSAGKTFTACFIAWVYALLNDNVQVYIVCPQRKQGKDIYWASNRIQQFGPQEFVDQHKESELRVIFKNGSVITIEGCENYESLRGIKPHLVIYDEFQHHSREFDMEVMQPNLMAKSASLVVMGTPPKRDCYYVEFRQRLLDEVERGDETREYFEIPSEINPTLDKAELAKKKEALFRSGDETIWYREYEGRLIFGGEGAVFPHWDKKVHVRRHDVLTASLERDRHKLKWFTVCDPGSTSCFAVLFGVHNPYTGEMFFLDEIYEKDRKKTSAIQMWEEMQIRQQMLYPNHPKGTFRVIYDEAAAWFRNEIQANFREPVTPTQKSFRDVDSDISLIKEGLLHEKFYYSSKLKWLPWEIENYVTDEKGHYPKMDDHLIDCMRYMIRAANYKFIDSVEPTNITYMDGMTAIHSPSASSNDWSENVLNDIDVYYDA